MLPLWRPPDDPTDEQRRAWLEAGRRIATGVELVAHLEPILAVDELRVGFCCDSEELAAMIAERILTENVGAETCRAHPGGVNQNEACDVVLPCRPGASSEEIDHAVLAAVKASHGLLCPTGAVGSRPRPGL